MTYAHKQINEARIHAVAEQHGAEIASITQADENTYASIDFYVDGLIYSIIRDDYGTWFSPEASASPLCDYRGYSARGEYGGSNVNITFTQLLACGRGQFGHGSDEAMLARTIEFIKAN